MPDEAEPLRARSRGGLLWLLAGLLAGLALTAALTVGVTQTRYGRERVLAVTLGALGDRMNGELRVQRLEGNLLAGARLYGVALRMADGSPFILADSAFVAYDLRTLLSDEVVLRRLALFDAEILVRRLPGDSLWNYQRLFRDTTKPPGPPSQRAVIIRQARLHDTRVLVRMPWEPDDTLSPAQRDSAVRDALSDTSRILVQRASGGFLRSMRFHLPEASIARLFYASEVRGGTYARVERLRGRAWVYREPIEIRALSGELALRERRFEFRAPTVVLPASRLAVRGVVYPGDTLRYDLRVDGERVALADMQWLYPLFPDSGGGSLALTLESRPDGGALVWARQMRMTLPGTRLRGSFGLLTGDTLRFFDVALAAEPVRVETIEQMLPFALPVRGLRLGSVEVRGRNVPPASPRRSIS